MKLDGRNLNSELLAGFRQWFGCYAHSFLDGDSERDRNIILKEEHTYRVCDEIKFIGRDLGLDEAELVFAEILALFHDVGRFEQYRRYKTFVDRDSVNHAQLGVEILKSEHVLERLTGPERNLVLSAIAWHNRADLPEDAEDTLLFFARLLRDADKLDIWKVVTTYYSRHASGSNPALELDLPDTPGISDGVYQDLMAGHIVYTQHLGNLNDFKMLQMGWVFDLNFTAACRRLEQKGYLEKIRQVLPEDERVSEVYERIVRYLRKRIDDQVSGAGNCVGA